MPQEDRRKSAPSQAALRALPSVDLLLASVEGHEALRLIPRRRMVEVVRQVLAAERRRVLEAPSAAPSRSLP